MDGFFTGTRPLQVFDMHFFNIDTIKRQYIYLNATTSAMENEMREISDMLYSAPNQVGFPMDTYDAFVAQLPTLNPQALGSIADFILAIATNPTATVTTLQFSQSPLFHTLHRSIHRRRYLIAERRRRMQRMSLLYQMLQERTALRESIGGNTTDHFWRLEEEE